MPATRAANSAKADKDFRVFLRQAHACLGNLTAEERETRIRRLEDFMLATGYAEKAAAIVCYCPSGALAGLEVAGRARGKTGR